jgi:hypothetical protein
VNQNLLRKLQVEAGGSHYPDINPDMQARFAELIVQHCIGVCEEMAAQCGGLPGDGALARDCAHWIRKDFGVEE